MTPDTPPAGPVRVKRKRRLWKVVAALALFAVGMVVGLPWLLGTTLARGWLVARINARLAPGSIAMEGLSLSWTKPVELSGLTLIDPKGKTILRLKQAKVDRSVLSLLASQSDLGTITIEGAEVDVERRADGSIDAMDALATYFRSRSAKVANLPGTGAVPGPAPIEVDDPTRVTIVLKAGKLRVASPELVEPIVAGTVEGSITIAPGQPVDLIATLVDDGRSMTIEGKLGRKATEPASLTVSSPSSWPFHVKQGGLDVKGRYEGTVAANRDQGRWSTQGKPTVVALEADGPSLSGDVLKLDRVALNLDLEQSADGWLIRQFAVNCPVGTIQAQGAWPTLEGSPTTVRGRLDLARLAKMLPNAMRLRDALTLDRGLVNIRADLASKAGSERVELALTVDDLAATEDGRVITLQVPPTLTGSATRTKDKVTVDTVEIKAAGVDVKGSGNLDDGVNLSGTIDLTALHAQLVTILDLGAVDFSGLGRIAADYRRVGETYQARLAADARNLKILGLTSTPILRDLARVDLSATGTRSPDGSPLDWQSARVDLKAGDLIIDVLARPKAESIAIAATIASDVETPAPGMARVEARLLLHPKARACDVNDLRAWLVPKGPGANQGSIGWGVQGTVDLAKGEATLKPIAGIPTGGLALGPDGLKLSRSSDGLKVEASLTGDLLATDNLLAAWTGAPPKGLKSGPWSARFLGSRATTGALAVDSSIDLADLLATGPATLALQGSYTPKVDRVDLGSFTLTTHYGRVIASGRLEDATTTRHAALSGMIEPAWNVIEPMILSATDPDARLQATVRPFHFDGSLRADSTPQLLSQIEGTFGVDLTLIQAYGVKVAPTSVVLKIGGGQANFEPIRTTINDGPTLLLPSLAFDNDYGLWLRLGAGSRVANAVINDQVSDELLSFVAPVLKKSSQVVGKVSVGLAGASIPITSSGATHLEGHVVFQDVVFNPGPMGTQFASITGRPAPRLALQQDVQILVADARVTQSGLSIPVGGDGLRVNLDGSVGFDKTLNARVTVPLTASMLGKDPRMQKLVDGMKVTLPIGGTLSQPLVDRKALQVALRDAGKVMIERGLKDEAGGILDKVGGSDADAIRGLLDGLGGKPRKK